MHISDLLKIECIDLNTKVQNKQEAINHAVDIISRCNCLTDIASFRKDVFAREEKGSTGFGNEIAIPHAKSNAVKQAALSALVVKDGVDFDSLDGALVKLIFLIASPENAPEDHLDVLARLSTLLIDDSFKQSLLAAHDEKEFLSIIDKAENKEIEDRQAKEQEQQAKESENKATYDIVAVTACPAGLSHTYMAAESLEHKAKEMGIRIKVETDGAAGNRNRLTAEDIANAKAVIVAADRAVELDRFIGKRMIRTGVVDGVRHPRRLIESALDPNCKVYQAGDLVYKSNILMRLYRHLMSGLTYILPLVATAGILAALSTISVISSHPSGYLFNHISLIVSTMILPVFSAFIAFSIAGRTALVAGFTGGVMAYLGNAGIFGALVNGFIGGFIAYIISKVCQRFFSGLDATLALILYPLLGAIFTALFAQLVTNEPLSKVDEFVFDFIINANNLTLLLVGAVLGGMMSSDLGGPFNKMAYAIGVLILADTLPRGMFASTTMATVMIAGMVPPLAAGCSCLLAKKFFSQTEQASALKALGNGLLFISEGAVPFMRDHSTIMRISFICGSAISGALVMLFKVNVCAPHGGILIMFISNSPLFFLLTLLCGVVVSTAICITLRARVYSKASHQG